MHCGRKYNLKICTTKSNFYQRRTKNVLAGSMRSKSTWPTNTLKVQLDNDASSSVNTTRLFQRLRSMQNLLFLKPDKGSGMIVMREDDYK